MVVWTLKTSDTKSNIPDIVYTGEATEKVNGLKVFTGARSCIFNPRGMVLILKAAQATTILYLSKSYENLWTTI